MLEILQAQQSKWRRKKLQVGCVDDEMMKFITTWLKLRAATLGEHVQAGNKEVPPEN